MSVKGPDLRSYRLSFQEDRHCSDLYAGEAVRICEGIGGCVLGR